MLEADFSMETGSSPGQILFRASKQNLSFRVVVLEQEEVYISLFN
jgi:hypothetical protein